MGITRKQCKACKKKRYSDRFELEVHRCIDCVSNNIPCPQKKKSKTQSLKELSVACAPTTLESMLEQFKKYLIHTNRQYRKKHFVFENVLDEPTCEKYLKKLKSNKSWSAITFLKTERRYQSIIKGVGSYKCWHPVRNLIHALGELTGQHYSIHMLGLYSKADCPQQAFHFDVWQYTNRKKCIPGNVYAAPWSLIFGIEEDTRIIIRNPQTQDAMTVPIPRGGVCFIRGDCEHAGAHYEKENYRLFVSLGTNIFKHDGKDVALLPENTNI
jgi:hypothetical protein